MASNDDNTPRGSYLDELKAQDKEISKKIKQITRVLGDNQGLADLKSFRQPKQQNRIEPPPSLPQAANDSSASLPQPANDSSYTPQPSPTDVESLETLHSIDSKLDENSNPVVEENTQSIIKLTTKLEQLSSRLSTKYEAANDETIVADDTTSSALADPPADPAPTTPVSVGDQLAPRSPTPSTELLENEKKSGKELGDVKNNPIKMGFDNIGGLLKNGFKSSVRAVDKVTGFLFKMTLSQAVNAAKTAAAIFAIIVAIDLIKIYWEKWGADVIAKLSEWADIFRGWWDTFTNWASQFESFTTAFETMGANLMAIKNAWETGDFPGLASAIGGAILDLAQRISATIGRVIASVVAAALRKFGFGDAADDVEAGALRYQQSATDNRLSPQEQKKLAENQVKNEEKDGKTTTERGRTDFLPNSWRNAIGILSDDEMKQIDKEKKDMNARKGLTTEQKVANTAATNEARESLERYKKFADSANPTNKNDMAKVNKYKSEAQQYLNDKNLALTPETKTELTRQYNAIKVKQVQVSPASSNESKDTQTVNAIKQNEATKAKQNANQVNTANVQNTVVKNNKAIHVQAPVTNTNAPGVFKATGVN